jgi:hypothetical protein
MATSLLLVGLDSGRLGVREHGRYVAVGLFQDLAILVEEVDHDRLLLFEIVNVVQELDERVIHHVDFLL